jgi:hypothetical protein
MFGWLGIGRKTRRFEGISYEIIAWAIGETVISYEMIGEGEGLWFLLSKNDADYHFRYGRYHASEDDYFTSVFGKDTSAVKLETAIWFAGRYPPFLTIPVSQFDTGPTDEVKAMITGRFRDPPPELRRFAENVVRRRYSRTGARL